MHGAASECAGASSAGYRLSIAVELDTATHHDSGVAIVTIAIPPLALASVSYQ